MIWLKGKGLDFWYKERPNAVQNWDTIALLSQLNEQKFDIATLQGTRWQGKDIMDTKSHIAFASGKEKGTREFGVGFVVDRNMKRDAVDFKADDDRMCILGIKTKFHNLSFVNVGKCRER